ncbi:hypothetical protein CIRG_09030 [Coccidioides immitis RMSCC 2394]|uniref:Uncharacterized protein n=1 Tax=Coccidioides immitis RMSCC 2394 TaxID=404692 RepID=A0A0J7BHK1_COCIT|nr:hypothetical protein CIRG_09030 [Coccidioides immitis RMSCC 2394]
MATSELRFLRNLKPGIPLYLRMSKPGGTWRRLEANFGATNDGKVALLWVQVEAEIIDPPDNTSQDAPRDAPGAPAERKRDADQFSLEAKGQQTSKLLRWTGMSAPSFDSTLCRNSAPIGENRAGNGKNKIPNNLASKGTSRTRGQESPPNKIA